MILRTKERREKNTLNKIFICVNERIVWKEGEIYKVLKRMKPNKASGPDGVRPIVLKRCAEQFPASFVHFQCLLSNVQY